MKFTLSKVAVTGLVLSVAKSGIVHAHCPLCTGGAAAAAGAAALLGVNYGAIGVFLGAFAAALGLWMPRLVKKRYVPRQNTILFWLVYLSTLLPLIPFTKDYSSVYISLFGDYGSIGNRTYLINWFIIGALLGSAIVWLSPAVSSKLTKLRGGKSVRFQGLGITFLLLLAVAVMFQLLR